MSNKDRNLRVIGYSFGSGKITVKYEYLITAAPYRLRKKYLA